MRQLDRENSYVVALVHAMIGSVSPNFRRVSLGLHDNRVFLQFVLAEESAEDREEIVEIEGYFDGQMDNSTETVTEVLVTTQDIPVNPLYSRIVFGRRES